MLRKVSVFIAVSVFWICNLQAGQTISYWTGNAGDSQWGNPNNWSPPKVPDNNETETFAVTIDSGGWVHILLEQNRTVDRLDTYNEVTLSKHNWEYNPVLTVLEPNDGLRNHYYLEIYDIDVQGDLYNDNGTRLNNVQQLHVLEGSIYNHGSIVCPPTAQLWAEYEFHNYGEVEIYGGFCSSDGPFTNEDTGVIKGLGMVHSDQVIHNAGLVQSLGGCLTLHSRVDFEGPYNPDRGITNTGTLTNSPGTSLTVVVWLSDANNQGTIEVNADGSVVFDCNNLNNEPNGIINLYGGTLAAGTITQKADANFVGFGGITGDVVIDPNGIIKLTGPTNIVGDVNIPANATLEISDGQTLITGHTTCKGTIHLRGGTVVFQGGCDCNECNTVNEAGTDRNHFDINRNGTVNFEDFAAFAESWLWQATWY